jgi:hypothetical protein
VDACDWGGEVFIWLLDEGLGCWLLVDFFFENQTLWASFF